jgi:hypothetical protein
MKAATEDDRYYDSGFIGSWRAIAGDDLGSLRHNEEGKGVGKHMTCVDLSSSNKA